jgi:dihydroorotate dehydrogenase (NAD+) catalytic subunit
MPESSRLSVLIGQERFDSPVWCGAGEHVMTQAGLRAALAAGAAVVVAKSFNETPAAAAQLSVADYTWLPDDSLFCRSGLVQRVPAEWIAEIAEVDREATPHGQMAVPSIVLADPDAAADLARQCHAQGLRALELNVGAPHGRAVPGGAISVETDPARVTAIVRQVREAFPGLLWVKLTGMSDNSPALALAAKQGGADAACLSGRFLGMVPSLETLAPELNTLGAYGGRWALPITCRALALARQQVGPDFPLIGTNGAWTGKDVARMILAGASAVQMATVVWREGFPALTQARADLLAFLTAKNVSARDLIGRAADSVQPYADQPERPGRWRDFVPEASR